MLDYPSGDSGNLTKSREAEKSNIAKAKIDRLCDKNLQNVALLTSVHVKKLILYAAKLYEY